MQQHMSAKKRCAEQIVCVVLFVGRRVLHTPTAKIVSPLDALFDVSQISLMGDRGSRWDWEYHPDYTSIIATWENHIFFGIFSSKNLITWLKKNLIVEILLNKKSNLNNG
jgi:hypothetical protein